MSTAEKKSPYADLLPPDEIKYRAHLYSLAQLVTSHHALWEWAQHRISQYHDDLCAAELRLAQLDEPVSMLGIHTNIEWERMKRRLAEQDDEIARLRAAITDKEQPDAN